MTVNIEEQTKEIALLMEEFISDVIADKPPPCSLIYDLTFKLEVLDRERFLDGEGL